jgi:hypothetical protein
LPEGTLFSTRNKLTIDLTCLTHEVRIYTQYLNLLPEFPG